MNLILALPEEVLDSRVVLRGRRAVHIHSVLKPAIGDSLRVGIIGVGRGQGTVESLGEDSAGPVVGLQLGPMTSQPRSSPLVTLTLALPRPKVLARVISAAASQGVAKIELINAWRVDKSYFSSPVLEPEALSLAARLGCEQGGLAEVPQITVHNRFMVWLERDDWEGDCFVLHPGSPDTFSPQIGAASTVRIAVGPEGGWIERELASLESAGFRAISIGESVLRVETATAVALGQIELMRTRR